MSITGLMLVSCRSLMGAASGLFLTGYGVTVYGWGRVRMFSIPVREGLLRGDIPLTGLVFF
jgi:hypothetical protein